MATAPKTNTVPKKETAPKKREMGKVLVIVPKPMNVIGDTETVVSVNGEMYQIMYDRPIEVPENVAEVIDRQKRQSLSREKTPLLNCKGVVVYGRQ